LESSPGRGPKKNKVSLERFKVFWLSDLVEERPFFWQAGQGDLSGERAGFLALAGWGGIFI
jgi:hypothetical protein